MKLTLDNYQQWHERNKESLKALLQDLKEDNDNKLYPRELELHVQDWHEDHEEYPDYYGTYWIQWEGQTDSIHHELDLDTLDDVMCAIHYAFENLKSC